MIDISKIMLLLGTGHKDTVYMSVSPIAGLEIIKVDTTNKKVMSYANRPLEYDEKLRNIKDYDAFKTAVLELYKELQIKPQCNVVLNLPTVLFARKEVPLILDDDAVRNVLLSEAEQTYTFKRHDPIVAWIDAKTKSSNEVRTLFYSALQQDVIDDIQKALTETGSTLVSINTSLDATINALTFSGLTEKMTKGNIEWNLIVITATGYSLCSMQGTDIIDYYDEVLALKSFNDTELYNAIISSLQIALMKYPSNFIYIVSSTNLVGAKILASRLKDVDIPAEYFENNIYRNEEILPLSYEILSDLKSQISLEAVGTALSDLPDIPMKMKFLTNLKDAVKMSDDSPIQFTIGTDNYEVTPQAAMKISAIICVILIAPIFLLSIIFSTLSSKLQTELDTLNTELNKIEAEVKAYTEKDSQSDLFNEKQEISKTVKNNRSKLMAYSALGETVPDNLWITYFHTSKDGQMDIKGAALSVEDISIFYKNLKDTLINSKIRLYKLEMTANNIDDAVTNARQSYIFEITNMSESALSKKSVSATGEETVSANTSDKKNKGNSKSDKSGTNQKEPAAPEILPTGLK